MAFLQLWHRIQSVKNVMKKDATPSSCLRATSARVDAPYRVIAAEIDRALGSQREKRCEERCDPVAC